MSLYWWQIEYSARDGTRRERSVLTSSAAIALASLPHDADLARAVSVTRAPEGWEPCAGCGRLTNEYNEDHRRPLHDACYGEWRFGE